MFAAACTTCRENPNGFLYVARVWRELTNSSNVSLGSVAITSRSGIVIESMNFKILSVIRGSFLIQNNGLGGPVRGGKLEISGY
jgi:hypothetical protein